MRCLLQLAIFSLLSLPMFAACHAVSVSGAGAKTGADWNNSYAFPPTFVRGDRYYVADGTGYAALDFTTAASGSLTVEVRKAQAYDYGRTSDGCSNDISAGWNASTMGSAQAIWGTTGSSYFSHWFYIEEPYLVLNGNGQQTTAGCGGAVGNSPTASLTTPTDCGIKIDDTSNCVNAISNNFSNTGQPFTVEYTDLLGCGNATNEGFMILAQNSTNVLVTHNYIHNFGSVCAVADSSSGFTFSLDYVFRNQIVEGGSPNHGQCIQVDGGATNGVIASNVIRDMSGTTAIATFGSGTTSSSGWKIYNNVVWNTPGYTPTFPPTDGMVACINSHTCNSLTVAQNTFVGMPSGANVSIENEVGGTITVQNNLWYDNPGPPTFGPTGTYTQDYNSVLASGTGCASGTNNVCNNSAANPFTNWTGGDFTLSADGANVNNRLALGAPYTTDAVGTTFTTDRGAYQFVSGSTVATPTFSPVAGTYSGAQSVTISTATGGATLCYTADGSTPTANGAGTCTHGTTYSSAVTVAASETLKAVGSLSGDSDSAVGSAAYVINYILSVPVTGSGSVSSSPSGIASCTAIGGTCSASFSSGTVVTLTQTTSATYYPFQGWSGSCSGSGACSVTMSAAESVGAEFCGPPNYPCSTVGTFISQTPNAAPFSGGTGYNQVRYDLSGLNAVPLNPLVRITDSSMLSGHSPSSTFTGGDNDAGWSCTGRADLSTACGAASLYYYAVTEGGAIFFEGIKYVGGVPQVVAPLPSTSSPLFSPQGAPAFASTDPSTAYEEIGATGSGAGIPAIKKVVLSWSGIVGQSPSFTENTIYNFAASCSVLPNGYAFGEQYSGGLSHDSTDNIFAVPLSNVRPVSGTTATATVGNGSTSVTFTTSAIGSAVIHSGAACTSCTYAVGDVANVIQGGASGGKIVVTAVSSGTPTSIAVWTIGTLYSTASSLPTTGGSGSGLQVDITNGMLTDDSYDGAQVTLNGVSGTYRIVSNTLTGFTISPAFSGTGCATSCTMTIGGGQGTGHWLLAYQISPAACAVYNTNTGAVLAAGAWTGGSIDTGCTGMLVHDGFLFHTGQYGQWSGASTGTSCGTQSTFWETGTTHAVPCTATVTGGGNLCGGHNTFGFNHEVIISNPNFYVFPPSAANSGTPYSSFGAIPLTGGAINCENHFSWQNVDANDTYPVIGATSNVNYSSSGSTSTWGYPTMNEVYVLQQNGTLTRIAHNFILGSSTLCAGGVGPFSAYFNAGEAIGVASQDGTMFAFSSDMLGQLGLDVSSATRADIFVVGLDQMAGSSTIFTGPSAPSFAKMPEPAHEPDPRLIRISKPN